MPRYRITIEYDGTSFVGWQKQPDNLGVQQVVEEAIHRFSGETVTIQAAGRTDSGVHARGQVAHFDLARRWEPFRIQEALNFHLKPHPVAIMASAEVDTDFEARFSATARHYEYVICNQRPRPVLELERVWHVPPPLDVDTMQEGAQLLLGKHDFTTFRASECQAKSPVRTLDSLEVTRVDRHVFVRASARSFLHNMVRSLVGSLKLIGEGKWEPNDIKSALDAKDRAFCGPLAPSAGLFLMRVDYDKPA